MNFEILWSILHQENRCFFINSPNRCSAPISGQESCHSRRFYTGSCGGWEYTLPPLDQELPEGVEGADGKNVWSATVYIVEFFLRDACEERFSNCIHIYIYIYSYKMQIEVKPLPNSQDLIRIYSIYIKVYASCQRSCQQGFNIPPGIHMLGPKILVHDRFLPIRLVIQHPDVSNLRPQKQTVKKPWDFLVCIGGKNTKNKDEKQTHDTKVYGKKTFLPRNIK